MSDTVNFGCIRCKRSKRAEDAVEMAEKTMESIFEGAFDMMQKEAATLGVMVPNEMKAKLMKLGVEHNIFPPEPVAK